MLCDQCDRDNPADGRFCASCGAELGAHLRVPVRLGVEYPESLSRLLLPVKWLFAIPLFVIWVFYSVAAYVVTFISFWAILFTGRYPAGMFEFAKGYQSFQFKVLAYFPLLLSDWWSPDEMSPVDYRIEYPTDLSRLALVFLKLPSFLFGIVPILTSVSGLLLLILSVPAWWAILFTGRYPRTLFEVSVGLFEWTARVTAWQYLLRDDRSLFGTTKPVQVAVGVAAVALVIIVGTPSSPVRLPGVQSLVSRAITLAPGAGDREAIVREFMRLGANGNADEAVMLLFEGDGARPELESLFTQNRGLFTDFVDVDALGFEYNKVFAGQETMALDGRILYSEGEDGWFYFGLMKLEGKWWIDSISINRP